MAMHLLRAARRFGFARPWFATKSLANVTVIKNVEPLGAGGRPCGNGYFRSAVARSAGLTIVTTWSRGLRPWALCCHPLRGFDTSANALTHKEDIQRKGAAYACSAVKCFTNEGFVEYVNCP